MKKFKFNETQKLIIKHAKLHDKFDIKVGMIEEFQKQIYIKASLIRSDLRNWSVFHDEFGRAIVGWKRITYGQDYRRRWWYNQTKLSAIEIFKRKVRAWLNKRSNLTL